MQVWPSLYPRDGKKNFPFGEHCKFDCKDYRGNEAIIYSPWDTNDIMLLITFRMLHFDLHTFLYKDCLLLTSQVLIIALKIH